jgi:hypothetical protein
VNAFLVLPLFITVCFALLLIPKSVAACFLKTPLPPGEAGPPISVWGRIDPARKDT